MPAERIPTIAYLPALRAFETKPVDVPSLQSSLREIGRDDLADSLSDPSTQAISLSAARRELIKLAIESGEIIAGWESPFPSFPVNSLESVKRFALNELTSLRMSISLNDDVGTDGICRSLRNIERAIGQIGETAPKDFSAKPENIFDGERMLASIVNLKPSSKIGEKTAKRNMWLLLQSQSGLSAKQIKARYQKENPDCVITINAIHQGISRARKTLTN